jgi:hypothetical protein
MNILETQYKKNGIISDFIEENIKRNFTSHFIPRLMETLLRYDSLLK